MKLMIERVILLLIVCLAGSLVGARGHNRANNQLRRHDRIRNQQTIDEKQSEFNKGKSKNICIGTNGRMSVPSNRNHHYRNLRDRFTNCTYVDGNLELTWLEDPNLELDFLKDIREVTGYVLISHVHVKNIILPRLQIIRGRTLFKLNIYDDQFGLFVSYSQMDTLELPALRDILAGSVFFFNNQNLCHIQSINWDEIITGINETFKYTYNFTFPEPECPKCHAICEAGCWGEGAHNCQQFSKVNCAKQCAQGRCFGAGPRDCCHLFCAGGCTGPTQKDCLACRNFFDDGVCKQECPPMQRYNPTNYLWEPNPEGKYAYGATCVRGCPEHLLKDNGACVRTCPSNKTSKNGECVPCNGPCPKTCPGVGVVHSGNIESFRDCTIIEGTLEILDQTFNGYQQVYANFSFGPRFIKMHPDRLEVFSTLREVTGYINIQGDHKDFTNLSYFRNLEVIGGRQLLDTYFASLYIVKTNLKSLELKSLKQINSGAVVILENKNLCFAEDIDWRKIKKSVIHESMISNNRESVACKNEGMVCSEECTKDGCWGPGSDQCLGCKHVKFNGTCLHSCQSQPNIYAMGDRLTCGQCHPECKRSCSGPEATDCLECVHVRDGSHCVPQCPKSKYAKAGYCVNCHETCDGCLGPNNTINDNGCITCEKAIIIDNKIERCLRKDEKCPDGYYYEYVIPQEQGILKPLAGKAICRKCHPRCKRCTGYGFHEQVCQECAGYKRGEQCEDECPSDHYADEVHRECFACQDECKGCYGSGVDNCLQCRNLKVFDGDPHDNSTSFNCTGLCPPEQPHKVYSVDQPYCSAEPSKAFITGSDSTAFSISMMILIAITLMLIVVFSIWWYHCFQKTKMKKDTLNVARQMVGCEDAEPLRPSNIGANLSTLNTIKVGELRINTEKLGSGAFADVYGGLWTPDSIPKRNKSIPVAIKILKNMNNSYSASKEFLDEAYIMATVDHVNLQRLLGVCMTDKMMLVTKRMSFGSLLDLFKNERIKSQIGSQMMFNWSTQIARGMAYLEEKHLVHRDLAARNVLVENLSTVKISDFGLAKLLTSESNEYKADGGKMPIKWLALECIRHRIFTTKSDVWAFGVTIWELLTFGGRPYENIPARDVPEKIEAGLKLEHPSHIDCAVYCTLLSCWNIDADSRPTFKELVSIFQNYASDPGRYLVIKGDKYFRSPQFQSHDEKDLIRALTRQTDESMMGGDEYLNAKRLSQQMQNNCQPIANALKLYNLDSRTKVPGDDETDSNRGGGLSKLRLDLPVDDEDYLLPGSQANHAPGYMDLIGTPACVENPEYLASLAQAAAAAATNTSTPIQTPILSSPPTQTIGIPITNGVCHINMFSPTGLSNHPMENGEQTSDHEYYNDLQRELQPLQRNETTV